VRAVNSEPDPRAPVVVAHCIPTGDSIEYDAFMSITRLMCEWPHVAPRSWRYKLCAGKGQPVSYIRCKIAKLAVSGKPLHAPDENGDVVLGTHYVVPDDVAADVLVWQDSDLNVEPVHVIRLVKALLALPDDVALLGAPCIVQEKVGKLLRPNLWEMPGDDPFARMEGGEPFEIQAIGFGLVAIRASVFRVLEHPWFWFDQRPDGGMVGEDVGFCSAVRTLGFRVYADPTIPVTHSFRRGFALDDTQLSALRALSKGGLHS